MINRSAVATLIVAVLLGLGASAASAGRPDMTKADHLFAQKHYAEAAETYAAVFRTKEGDWHRAAERFILCKLRLELYDEAIEAAEEYVARTEGTRQEARAERLMGHLYMLLPHWGTRAGGEFHRGEHRQGIRLQSWRHDKKHAVRHMERARQLYAEWDTDADDQWREERIGCIFDLASLVARFSIYSDQPHFWYSWWGERDDALADTAGEEDFDEGYNDWHYHRRRPIGLRVGADGNPVWPERPADYSNSLEDDEKILYLLHEVRRLDRSEAQPHAALSYYRQAMLARKRFGMDRLNAYADGYYADGRRPLQETLQEYNPWELQDNEALVLVGGHVRRVELPEQFGVLALLRKVSSGHETLDVADQALYATGLYYQSRQQYVQALQEYSVLRERSAGASWARHAAEQARRIREPQVRLSDTGVQLPGRPAELQVSYRNVGRIWFVARSFDLESLLQDLHNERPQHEDYWAWQRALTGWHSVLVREPDHRDVTTKRIARYVGEEIGRWSHPVEEDGTHRYSQVTLQSTLSEAGAYLVCAYAAAPPAQHASKQGFAALGLGASRAVVVLTDLAYIEKKTNQGSLYYVAEAVTGAPVANAELDVIESWNTYDRKRRKHLWHWREQHTRTTREGMCLLQPDAESPGDSRTHLLITAPDGRLAWSGMSYYRRYHPSRMREGTFSYVITDRPVYRPGQAVHYKVWMRYARDGVLQNLPHREVQITVFDPRGDQVQQVTKRTDDFGGFDGEMVLGEEPPLGIYRIEVKGERYAGGQNFRVEEYKKPEFEVTVEPSKVHARLGEAIEAVIRADYYFGAPVTDANVSYKVFREEYTHTHYPPGPWDWLYGPGYGLPWYPSDWFPWWSEARCCWQPPGWWPGWQPRSPVRELVRQGQARIGADGKLAVEIETGTALRNHPDRDHRYVIEAEVTDASRRTVIGQGDVTVTRQAFYATVHSDRGYYRPGQEMTLTIRCMTPDDRPVETEGVVTVSRIVWGGPDNARADEQKLDQWRASTNAEGVLRFRLRHERSDQLKITFRAPDRWGETVKGHGLVWVVGRDFDGRLHRFNDIELITDKRTYKPGETCRLMVNTRRPNSYVLLADEVDNGTLLSWRLLHLRDGHTVVDIPVRKADQSNAHVEASTVADLRVHQQVVRINVPPADHCLDVGVRTDKAEYAPGEEATICVTACTADGEPARNVQVALSGFDRSVLYIQPEYTPRIAAFFHGQVRTHHPQMQTNLLERFAAQGYLRRPFQALHPLPPAWHATWGPDVRKWWSLTDEELNELMGRSAALGGMRRGATIAEGEVLYGVAAPMANAKAADAMAAEAPAGAGPSVEEPQFAEAAVREQFADTALWLPSMTTGPDGQVTATVTMPENLTTWKLNAWAMGRQAQVGQGSADVVTTKDLLVRLQAPRFFMEYDEVVISANVHNYLPQAKAVQVSLQIPEEHLELMDGSPVAAHVDIPAEGERRVDWRVKVLEEGTAAITVRALTDEESDAMRMTFPVLVHGMTKQDSFTGSARAADGQTSQSIEFTVPERRRPELTRLEVQYAPSLVGAMIDALPYCLHYPYGCTEQTVSRFLPAVLTLKTLRNMGISLEEVRNIRGRLEEVRRTEKGENLRFYADSPIFDSDELQAIIRKGLKRIAEMQQPDGGWAWWKRGTSSPYLTSYVLDGLLEAREADVAIDAGMLENGASFLRSWQQRELEKAHWSASATHAYVAYVLARTGTSAGDCLDRLFAGRDQLNLYGKALLAMALHHLGDGERASISLRNIMQYLEQNEETGIAWFRTPREAWWYWYNNDIETNAWCLRAIVRIDPESDAAPQIVKWLLENRRNGYYWRSTRDTTLCVTAMSEYVAASGEGRPDYALTLSLDDGAVTKTVRINRDNFFTYDNRLVVEGVALEGGRHTLRITKDGPGALYWSAWIRYFTQEESIAASGLQLKLDRRYFRLEQMPFDVQVEGAEGHRISERRLRYKRIPLEDGDAVHSGDLVQVEMEVTSDNDYTFLMFEDPKPAGCEPIELRSGAEFQEGFASYMELRDEKVAFFVDTLGRGNHLLRYRYRAEVPGVFHALPAVVQGMYAPELRGNSDEQVVRIVDR